MKPILNYVVDGIGKYIIDLPTITDEDFEKMTDRLGRLSIATAPALSAIAEGLARGGVNQIKEKING